MPSFTLSLHPLDLPLKHAFTITRGSRKVASNLLLEIRNGAHVGYGEFAPNKRYNETLDTVREAVSRFDPERLQNPYDLAELHVYLNALYPDEGSVRAGIEMAYADLLGKYLNVPLWKLWNAPSPRGPVSSFTIGIDTEEILRQKVDEAAPYPVLKIKLGTDHDRDIVRLIRSMTDKEIWVDANEGWTNPDEAVALAAFMAENRVTMIEQPMPAHMRDELRELKSKSALPIIADEGFTGKESMADIADCYHGINLKLMKTGGMIPALQAAWQARKLGLQVMVGCMIESSVANSAAAVVALWSDYCDLDSHVLISEDPFNGLHLDADGHVILPDRPGLGVIPVS